MKVKEFIKILQKAPQDAEIVSTWEATTQDPPDGVYVVDGVVFIDADGNVYRPENAVILYETKVDEELKYTWSSFTAVCRGCGRKFRISNEMLAETKDIMQESETEKLTDAEVADTFEFCLACAIEDENPEGEIVEEPIDEQTEDEEQLNLRSTRDRDAE